MKAITFITLCIFWIADVVGMVALSPLGGNALWFSVLYCLGHVLMVILMLKFPSSLSPNRSLTLIFFLGLIARFIFLWHPPGNDIYRYIWEGYIQNQGINPYVLAPSDSGLADLAAGEINQIWQQINHPDLSAAYPPFILLLFRFIAVFSREPIIFKAVMAVFDIGVMIILMLMIRQQSIHPSRLLLYAANPLVLVYIAGEGHLDVVQLFFLCLALYLVVCNKYCVSGFLMLGLAVVSKYFAILALPFLLNSENRLKAIAVLIPIVLYFPFIGGGSDIFKSLTTFASQYHYNDSLAMLLRFLWRDGAIFLTVSGLAVSLGWIYLFVHDRLRSVYLAFGCLLLFLPTLHPWYLVLLVPFLVFYPSRAWLYLNVGVVFTFPVIAVESATGVFQEIPWLKLFEYVPFYTLLAWGLLRGGYLLRNYAYHRSQSISAVIPTLNEQTNIGRCIQSIKNRTAVAEIIVADGGSTDNTREIALRQGCRVIESRAGRGVQIEAGVKAASGDVVLIMHADCIAADGLFKRLIKALDADSQIAGGAFAMLFEPITLRTRFVAFLNNLRTRLTGISFGDQAQFFRKEALEYCGGFPAIMLMEDVELSLRLKEAGRLVFLGDGIVVSDRRWHSRQFAGNLTTVFYLFFRYLIERRWGRADVSAENYYKAYYT